MNTETGPVVVGIDGSPQGVAALRYAIGTAADLGTSVRVVHCWAPSKFTDLVLSTPAEMHRQSLTMLNAEVSAATAALRPDLGEALPPIEQRSLHGRAAKVLLEESTDAAELVLGAHGRTVLHDVVYGQVIATCLKQAAVAVTVVDRDGTVINRTQPKSVAG